MAKDLGIGACASWSCLAASNELLTLAHPISPFYRYSGPATAHEARRARLDRCGLRLLLPPSCHNAGDHFSTAGTLESEVDDADRLSVFVTVKK